MFLKMGNILGDIMIWNYSVRKLFGFFCFFKFLYSFFEDFIYLFSERGREEEREGEKHQCVVASSVLPTEDLAHNPGPST